MMAEAPDVDFNKIFENYIQQLKRGRRYLRFKKATLNDAYLTPKNLRWFNESNGGRFDENMPNTVTINGGVCNGLHDILCLKLPRLPQNTTVDEHRVLRVDPTKRIESELNESVKIEVEPDKNQPFSVQKTGTSFSGKFTVDVIPKGSMLLEMIDNGQDVFKPVDMQHVIRFLKTKDQASVSNFVQSEDTSSEYSWQIEGEVCLQLGFRYEVTFRDY